MKYREGLSRSTFSKKIELTKDFEINRLFTTPIRLLNKRYKDLFGVKSAINEEEIEAAFSRRTLGEIIDDYLDFGDVDYEEGDEISEPYFVYLDSQPEKYVGFLVFIWKDSTHISDIVLFSFDVENSKYARQIYTDLEIKLREFIDSGVKVSWTALKRNHACESYDGIVRNLHGKRIEDEEDPEIYIYSLGDSYDKN